MASKIRKFLDIQGLLKLIRLVKNNEQPHWIGTQAEYDSQKANIPAGTIVALTDDEDTDYDHGKYALVETVTGKRWIDGKPIYRKCFKFTTPSTIATTPTQYMLGRTGILKSEIDSLVRFSLYQRYTNSNGSGWTLNGWGAYGGTTSSNIQTNAILAVDSQSDFYISEILSGTHWQSQPCIVILEYTKTTD